MFDPVIGPALLIGGGLLGGGAAYLGSKEQSDAAKAAAGMQNQYGMASIDFQREMFNKLLELQQPYYNIGTTAINPFLKSIGLPSQPVQPQKADQGQNALAGILEDYNKYKTSMNPPAGTGRGIMDIGPSGLPNYMDPSYIMGDYKDPTLIMGGPQAGPSFEDWYKARQVAAPSVSPPEEVHPTGVPLIPDETGEPGDLATGFTKSPLYQWQLEEGTNALNNALRARGKYDSTAGLRSIGDFTRALGAEETEKYYNRLLDAINIGRGAATVSGQGAMQTGANVGSTYNQLGSALASNKRYEGEANASFWSGLGGLPMNLASIYYLMKKP